jgi:SPP1 gp7 family putative phage head morphogenesis protein
MPKRRPKIPKPQSVRRFEDRYAAGITTLLEPFKELVEAELFPMLDFITQARPVKLDAAGPDVIENLTFKINTGMLPGRCRSTAGVVPGWRLDAAVDDIRAIFDKIRIGFARSFPESAIDRLAKDQADVIDTINHKTFRNQTKTVLGVDPTFAEPWLADEIQAFVHENASLIKTIPIEHLSDIEQMIFRESRRGASPGQIRAKLTELFGAADRSAALIARDQISKFNGRLSELRQTAAGVTDYIWRTVEDGRVRSLANSSGYSSHARLNGEKFSWKNPPITVFKGKRAGERNHPGQDINCRCYAEPVLDKLIKGAPENGT